MLSDAVNEPTAAGLNVMLIMHEDAAARLVPQLLVCENEEALVPVKDTPEIVSADLPVFARVTVCTELAYPSTVEGNERLAGERPTIGALEAGHLLTTFATFNEPRPVAAS
jgi:hypothetical protein